MVDQILTNGRTSVEINETPSNPDITGSGTGACIICMEPLQLTRSRLSRRVKKAAEKLHEGDESERKTPV
jgi:hypothetical protein